MSYIIFAKADNVNERIKEAGKRAWTAPKTASPNDIALFYFGGSNPGIYAIGRTATRAKAGRPNPEWTKSKRGFFARHKDIRALGQPLYLREIRTAFPTWKRWNNLRGVRVHIIPSDYEQRLADLIATKNPSSPFPSEDGARALEGVRTEVVTYKQGRSRALRDRALARSNGICKVCRVNYSALLDGRGVRVLQVHHRKQLAATDRPQLTKLSDLAVVCANCHLLIHMDSKKALSVEKLRAMMRETRA